MHWNLNLGRGLLESPGGLIAVLRGSAAVVLRRHVDVAIAPRAADRTELLLLMLLMMILLLRMLWLVLVMRLVLLVLPVVAPPAASAPPRTSPAPSSASAPGSPVVPAAAVPPLRHVLVAASRRHHGELLLRNPGKSLITAEDQISSPLNPTSCMNVGYQLRRMNASVAFYPLLLFPPAAHSPPPGLGGAGRPARSWKRLPCLPAFRFRLRHFPSSAMQRLLRLSTSCAPNTLLLIHVGLLS